MVSSSMISIMFSWVYAQGLTTLVSVVAPLQGSFGFAFFRGFALIRRGGDFVL